VTTTGAALNQTITKEQSKAKADFSIITDPAHPASVPVLSSTPGKVASSAAVTSITPTTPVVLNQYNIKAYPENLFR
jgi:hypothetical protein